MADTNGATKSLDSLKAQFPEVPEDTLIRLVKEIKGQEATSGISDTSPVALFELLEEAVLWLESALKCKEWQWDPMQRDCAEDVCKRSRKALQSVADQSQGQSPVGEVMASANPELTMAFFDAKKVPPRTQLFADAKGVVLRKEVPEGYALVPEKMVLDLEAMENLLAMTGDEFTQEAFPECLLWVGETINEDTEERCYGLNVACNECLEEGSNPVITFKKPDIGSAC